MCGQLKWLACFAAVVVVMALFVPPALAGGTEVEVPQQITLQQAVDMALSHSKELKKAEYEVNRAFEVRDFRSDDVKYIPQGPSSPEAEQLYTAFVSSDINWQMAQKNYEALKDSIVASVQKAYYGVIKARHELSTCELELKNYAEKRRISELAYRAGTLSKAELVQAEAAKEGAEAKLVAAQKALDDAYQKFNLLIGLEPDERPVLDENVEFEPLVIDNLDTEVQRAIETSPSVWLAARQIDLARLAEDLYFAGNRSAVSEPYEAKKIDIDKAEVSLADTKEKVNKLVRTLYYTALQLEDQYSGKLQSKNAAEENLRVVKAKYSVGMATNSEVIAAELALAQAERDLLNICCDHSLTVTYFRKPWTYS